MYMYMYMGKNSRCKPRTTPAQTSLTPDLNSTWAPQVFKIMAFMAIIVGLGLLFYILWGFRYRLCTHGVPTWDIPSNYRDPETATPHAAKQPRRLIFGGFVSRVSWVAVKELQLRHYPPIMENQMEKKMENEMETGEYRG